VTRPHRPRDERGTALLESPFAIITLLAIGLGVFWVGNIVLRYHQLEEAVRAGSRYGARTYFAPGGNGQRRRTSAQITTFTSNAARPIVVTVEIRCGTTLVDSAAPGDGGLTVCSDPENQAAHPAGSFLQVRATATVSRNDPIMGLARSVNALFSLMFAGKPLPDAVTVSDSSVATVE
jgi:Flp pilus assembly protein TadG